MRPPRHGHRWLAAVAAACGAVALTVAQSSPAWGADLPIPSGFTVTAHDQAAEGVEHLVLTRADPAMVVNVARIAAGAPVSLRAVLSNDTVAGDEPRLETTSRMCARVGCLFGVNADFAGVGTDQPLGAFVTDGELLRSPSNTHHQLSLTGDGRLTDQTFAWTGRLMTTDLKQLSFDGVNVDQAPGKIVLYTPAYGPTTKTPTPGVDLVVRVVEPAGEFRLGQTALVDVLALNEGAQDAPIPPDGAVLSADGAGADALRALWNRTSSGAASNQAFLRLEANEDVRESVGGSPILVKDGKRWFTDPGDNFTNGRHPRTLVGWTPGGDTLLVTVDGRQPAVSVGMTLHEAAQLLIDLGASEGINLDGGGSTTFVRGGSVVNSVSDVQVRSGGKTMLRHSVQNGDKVLAHVERPVASALVVVPRIAVSVPPVDPLAGVALGLREQALALPGGTSASPWVSASAARGNGRTPSTKTLAAGDPASAPDGRLPALIGPRPEAISPIVRVAVMLDVLALMVVAGGALIIRRRSAALFS
ncbi:MAG TPA: phosphodiester glycosidase family protein [Acidimicrobiia bacterium]|nr:phosphodiester glycosidase family protein [Acidimicrobiia bacterium]